MLVRTVGLVSDIAIFVLKRDVKLQLTNIPLVFLVRCDKSCYAVISFLYACICLVVDGLNGQLADYSV